jgi:hypothetical protein
MILQKLSTILQTVVSVAITHWVCLSDSPGHSDHAVQEVRLAVASCVQLNSCRLSDVVPSTVFAICDAKLHNSRFCD